MAKKKTFKVDEFKNYVNEQLARTDKEATEEFKAGLCVALGTVLMRSDNYKGYSHTYWTEGGCTEWRNAGEPDFPEKYKYIYGEGGHDYNRYYN